MKINRYIRNHVSVSIKINIAFAKIIFIIKIIYIKKTY